MIREHEISEIDARHLLGYIKGFRETKNDAYADDCAMEIEQLVLDNLGFLERCLEVRLGVRSEKA